MAKDSREKNEVRTKSRDPWDALTLDLEVIIYGTGVVLGVLVIGLSIARYQPSHVIAVVGMAMAAFVVTFVIGFLFGYPLRRDSDTQPRDPGGSAGDNEGRGPYEDNTSLSQISDWLTKIILGIGLVQFGDFSARLNDFCQGFAQESHEAGAFYVALSTILVFAGAGVLSGVLWTRLRLQSGLNAAARGLMRDIKRQVDKLSQQRDLDRKAIEQIEEALASTSEGVDIAQLVEHIDAASEPTFAKIREVVFAHRRNHWAIPGEARRKVGKAAEVLEALTKTKHGKDSHDVWGQYGYALKDQEPENWTAAAEALSEAIRLRKQAQLSGFQMYEYNRAICRIMLSSTPHGDASATPKQIDEVIADLRAAVTDHRSRSILANTKVFQVDPWLSAVNKNFYVDVDFVPQVIAEIERPMPLQNATLEVLSLACRIKPAEEERVATKHVLWALAAYLDRSAADRDLNDEDVRLGSLFRKYARIGAMEPRPLRIRYESDHRSEIPEGQRFSQCVRRALEEPSDPSLKPHALGLTEIFYNLARRSTGDTFNKIRENLAKKAMADASAAEHRTLFFAEFEKEIERLGLDAFIPEDVRKLILAKADEQPR